MKYTAVLCAWLGLVLALVRPAAADPGPQLEAVAVALERIGGASDAARFREAVAAIPPEGLEAIYGDADLQSLVEALDRLDQNRIEAAAATQATRDVVRSARLRALDRARSAPEAIQSAGLPKAPFPNNTTDLCPDHSVPGTKSDTRKALETLDKLNTTSRNLEQAEISISAARGVWDAIGRACKQAVIVAGFGGNFSSFCIPIDIVFTAAELIVAEIKWAGQFTQQEYDRIAACDKSIETAEIAGGYNRLKHVHADVEEFKKNIEDRLETLDGKADLLLKVLLEGDLHVRSTSRLSVNYTERLAEACKTAQTAIDESSKAGYAPATAAQALHDLGRKLIPTDPKRALELCQDAYRKVTGREATRLR
jgi:hypothetical protein